MRNPIISRLTASNIVSDREWFGQSMPAISVSEEGSGIWDQIGNTGVWEGPVGLKSRLYALLAQLIAGSPGCSTLFDDILRMCLCRFCIADCIIS